MIGTNLWWFVALPDRKYEYRRSTHEKMELALENREILAYTIVHPDNPMYAKDLRKFNRRYLFLINSKHSDDVKKLFQMEHTPVSLITSGTQGVYSQYRNLLEMRQMK